MGSPGTPKLPSCSICLLENNSNEHETDSSNGLNPSKPIYASFLKLLLIPAQVAVAFANWFAQIMRKSHN